MVFLTTLCVSIEMHGQLIKESDLYGKWRIKGDFKDGEQTLGALKDTLKNPVKYYKEFNEDGTYISDVVSLKWGYKGKKMKGKWHYNSENNSLVIERELSEEEQKQVPEYWLQKKDMTYFLVPVEYPIVELNRNRLILHDLFHDTYMLYTR